MQEPALVFGVVREPSVSIADEHTYGTLYRARKPNECLAPPSACFKPIFEYERGNDRMRIVRTANENEIQSPPAAADAFDEGISYGNERPRVGEGMPGGGSKKEVSTAFECPFKTVGGLSGYCSASVG